MSSSVFPPCSHTPASREALRFVSGALRLSSHVVANDPRELRGQLVGRLGGVQRLEEVRRLVDDLARSADRPWLCPLAPTLTSPGGPLRWIVREEFHSVGVTPDGSVAWANNGSLVKVLDLRTGQELPPLAGRSRGVDWVSMATDGSRVVFSDYEGTAGVWDLERTVEIQSLGECNLDGMALSTDGRRGVASVDEGKIGIFDLDSAQVIRTLECTGSPRWLSGDTEQVVLQDGGLLLVASVRDGRQLQCIDIGAQVVEVSWEAGVALAPGEETGLGSDRRFPISVWSLESGERTGQLEGHGDRIRCLAITGDGRTAASGARDGTVRVWDMERGNTVAVLRHGPATREGGVDAVSLSADGRTVVSLGASQLRVWSLPETRPVRVLEGHEGKVTRLNLSLDGRRAVTAGSDFSVRLWDLETGRTTLVVRFEGSQCGGVTFLGSGPNIVSDWNEDFWAHYPGEEAKPAAVCGIVLIDPAMKKALVLSREFIGSTTLAPDGSWGMSGNDARYAWRLVGDHTLEVITAEYDEEEEERQVLATIEPIGTVTIMPDGRRALSTNACREEYDVPLISLWDLESDETIRSFEGHEKVVHDVAALPGGDRFLSASEDHTLRLWDIESGKQLQVFWGHEDKVNSVEATPDGSRAVSGSRDGTVIVWDLATGEAEKVLEGHTGAVNAVAVTPDGRAVLSASDDHTIRVWDLESGHASTGRERHLGPVTGVAVAGDANRAISVIGRQMTLWDLGTRSVLKQLEYPWRHMGGSVALGSDGETALTVVLGNDDQPAGLLEWGLGEEDIVEQSIEEIICHAGPRHDFGVTAAALTPDLDLALCGCDDHTVRLWHMRRRAHIAYEYVSGYHAEGEEILCLAGHAGTILDVAITPDGQRGLSASTDQTLRLWDLDSGRELCTLEGHAAPMTSVAIGPDGRLAVSGGSDGTIKMWDLSEVSSPGHRQPASRVRTIRPHGDAVSAVALTPDARYGVSAGRDHAVRVWDVVTGEAMASLTLEAPVLSCAVHPLDGTVVAGDETGHVHFLKLAGTP